MAHITSIGRADLCGSVGSRHPHAVITACINAHIDGGWHMAIYALCPGAIGLLLMVMMFGRIISFGGMASGAQSITFSL